MAGAINHISIPMEFREAFQSIFLLFYMEEDFVFFRIWLTVLDVLGIEIDQYRTHVNIEVMRGEDLNWPLFIMPRAWLLEKLKLELIDFRGWLLGFNHCYVEFMISLVVKFEVRVRIDFLAWRSLRSGLSLVLVPSIWVREGLREAGTATSVLLFEFVWLVLVFLLLLLVFVICSLRALWIVVKGSLLSLGSPS